MKNFRPLAVLILLSGLFDILVILKAGGVIDISWWLVTAPLSVPLTFFALMAGLDAIRDRRAATRE